MHRDGQPSINGKDSWGHNCEKAREQDRADSELELDAISPAAEPSGSPGALMASEASRAEEVHPSGSRCS